MRFWIVGLLMMMASPGWASCLVSYKAKQDDPLRLHFGVMEVSTDCSAPVDLSEVSARLAVDGWILLVLQGPVSEDDLPSIQAQSGAYFLRY